MKNNLSELEKKLFNEKKSELSDHEATFLIEQYKLYVETMNKISDRRHQANTFFLSINTFLIAALSSFLSITKILAIQYIWLVFAGTAGIIFCIIWHQMIRAYSQLNHGKFRIINMLETKLAANIFETEWEVLNRGDGSVYKPFTRTEIIIPFVFAILYIIIIFCSFVSIN